MKRNIQFIARIMGGAIVLLWASFPRLSHAAGLVPCGGLTEEGLPEPPCDFNQLLNMVNIIIDFALTKLVLPIAAIMFAYAGVIYLTSGGSGKVEKAKQIFVRVFLGLVIALTAFLIIKTILTSLGFSGPMLLE